MVRPAVYLLCLVAAVVGVVSAEVPEAEKLPQPFVVEDVTQKAEQAPIESAVSTAKQAKQHKQDMMKAIQVAVAQEEALVAGSREAWENEVLSLLESQEHRLNALEEEARAKNIEAVNGGGDREDEAKGSDISSAAGSDQAADGVKDEAKGSDISSAAGSDQAADGVKDEAKGSDISSAAGSDQAADGVKDSPHGSGSSSGSSSDLAPAAEIPEAHKFVGDEWLEMVLGEVGNVRDMPSWLRAQFSEA